jgi:quinol monooxygenase YgiN
MGKSPAPFCIFHSSFRIHHSSFPPELPMIYLNIWLTVKEQSDVEQVQGLLSEQGRLSRQEPGCARFEVYHSQTDPLVFMLCERWESQSALDKHREGKAYTTIYKPQVLPLVDRVPHPSTLIE